MTILTVLPGSSTRVGDVPGGATHRFCDLTSHDHLGEVTMTFSGTGT